MGEICRLKGLLAHPRHCGATNWRRMQSLGLSLTQPSRHHDTPEQAKLCATPAGTLLYQRPPHPWLPFTQNHTWASADNNYLWSPLWLSVVAFSSRSLVRVCIRMTAFCRGGVVSVGPDAAGKRGQGDKSCGADVPTASGAPWMAAVVMVTGKRVGGQTYALQSSEWLEFNMVAKKSSCVQIGHKVASLSLFLYSFTFYHSLDENVAVNSIVFTAPTN